MSSVNTDTQSPVKSFKLNEYSMHTLRASLKELQKDVLRKLGTPLFKYFISLYKRARDEVLGGSAPWEGDFADLRWFQDLLRDIPKWNTSQIKSETQRVLDDVKSWPASDIIGAIFYIKSMILASIRPSDMTEDVYIPIASIENYLHTVMRLVAKQLFAHPSIVRRFPEDDDDTITANVEKIHSYIQTALLDAITDLTPTSEIVQKYVKQVLVNVKRDTTPREMDESEKYGFEDPMHVSDTEQDDDDEDDGEDGEDERKHDSTDDDAEDNDDTDAEEYDDEEADDDGYQHVKVSHTASRATQQQQQQQQQQRGPHRAQRPHRRR